MPEIMRQVARVVARNYGALDDGELWISKWAAFFFDTLGVREKSEDDDDDEPWVDEVVTAFCARASVKGKMHSAIHELIGE